MSAPFKTMVIVSLLLYPVLAACTSPQPTTAIPSTPALPSPPVPLNTPTPAATTENADATALAGVRALQSFDTTVDRNPNDTARRAAQAGWLTTGFAAAVTAFSSLHGPGERWAMWASHHAYVHVDARLGGDDHPPDTPSSAYRQVVVTLLPVGRDGWAGTPTTQILAVTLRQSDGRWRIASFTTA